MINSGPVSELVRCYGLLVLALLRATSIGCAIHENAAKRGTGLATDLA